MLLSATFFISGSWAGQDDKCELQSSLPSMTMQQSRDRDTLNQALQNVTLFENMENMN